MTKEQNILPSHWIYTKLGEIVTFSQGIQVPKPEQFDSPAKGYVRFLRIIDFTQEKEPARYIKDPGQQYQVKEDDLSMVRYGSAGAIVRGLSGAIANNLFRVIPTRTDLSKDYLYHFFSSQLFKQEVNLNTKGATMQAISFGFLKKMGIPLPPLEEQQRIVAKIEELFTQLDAAIASLQKAQQQLATYRQAVLKWAFEGKLTNDNVKEGELPEGWEVNTIEESSDRIVDCLHSTPKFVENGKYCVDTTCIQQGKIIYNKIRYVSDESFEERIRRLKPEAGDILFSREGTVGTALVVPKGVEICLGQRMMMFRPKNHLLSKYFMYALQSPVFVKQYLPLIGGTTSPHLNIRDIRKFTINIPNQDEQTQIVQEIEARLSEADKLEETIAQTLQKAEALRQSILKRAFEGKLVPQLPAEAPAVAIEEQVQQELNLK